MKTAMETAPIMTAESLRNQEPAELDDPAVPFRQRVRRSFEQPHRLLDGRAPLRSFLTAALLVASQH